MENCVEAASLSCASSLLILKTWSEHAPAVWGAQAAGLQFAAACRGPHSMALDYCVEYSALDARQLGLTTCVILDGCRGIELEPGDIQRALNEMKRAGAVLLKSSDL
jgi:Isochorismatase family